MWFLYVLCIIPFITGAILWYKSSKIVWWEWLSAFVISLITAIIFHVICIKSMTTDIQTLSGVITKAVYYPEWVERYQVPIYKTIKVGKSTQRVFSHYETRYRTHSPYYECHTSFGTTKNIDKNLFEAISKNFNDYTKTPHHKSGFHSGDPDIYMVNNKTGYCYPITTISTFENKVKASPSLFSFMEVPKTAKVYEWPSNKNWMRSDRLLGTSFIDVYEWDKMNSRLGPTKKVNVIMVGFDDKSDPSYGLWQQAKWVGGKKNDLVITFGGGEKSPAKWAFVFGWTEKELVKKKIESILLNNPINNEIIPKIETAIIEDYVIKDWTKFDYITVEPPMWAFMIFLAVLIISQFITFVIFYKNDSTKDSKMHLWPTVEVPHVKIPYWDGKFGKSSYK